MSAPLDAFDPPAGPPRRAPSFEVHFFQPGATGEPQRVGRAWLDRDGQLQTDRQDLWPEWQQGLVGREERGRVTPLQPERFLEELPHIYRSAYFWAEAVT